MDSVRFGRVLGIGTRLAARTLVNAVDAATAANPAAAKAAEGRPAVSAAPRAAVPNRESSAPVPRAATVARVKQGSRRFGEAAWGPFVRLSGVLWLEFTGVFFGVFALFATVGAWQRRGDFRLTPLNQVAHQHFLGTVLMAVVFIYFCVSSFVRAYSRGRRGSRS